MVKAYAVNCNDAWLIPNDEPKEGHYVKYEDYERLDNTHSAALAKIDALAAENAALKAAFAPKEIPTEATDVFSDTAILKIDGDEFHSSQWVDNEADVIRAVLDFFKPETTATDAILASLRAEGVEMLAAIAGNECKRYKSINDRAGLRKWKSIVILCSDFAAQLRSKSEVQS